MTLENQTKKNKSGFYPTLNCAAHNQCVVDEDLASDELKKHFQLARNVNKFFISRRILAYLK